ncbi:MAG: cell division protein [Rhodospirillaceae bacterium]|nr:MAG: cell division protein [Rhodospirillaceae bacterium]
MFAQRTDLPLDKDPLSKFLPWLIAFMVYLAALSQAGLIGLDSLANRWDTGMAATMTVQIPADPDATAATNTRRLQIALNMVSEFPGVLNASVISQDKVLELLSPWLGLVEAADVPLPILIDVETNPDVDMDARVLQQKLAKRIPGTQVDDHGVWLARLIEMVRTLEGLAAGLLLFILLSAAGTVIFTTRTGLTVHAEAIEVLHLTGAHDRYIAKQFAGRAMSMGLKGGLYGIGLAVLTLLLLGHMAGRMEAGLLPDIQMPLLGWVSLAVLPLLSAMVAGMTARHTVMRNLRRML